MSTLSQTDLSVRLQLLGCKYSELINTYANNLKYGQKCATNNLKDLLLLNSLIEILECYTIPYDRSGIIEAKVTSNLHIGWILNIYSDGVSISGNIVLASTDPLTIATQISNTINGYQDEIIAEVINDSKRGVMFRLTTPCSNPIITTTTNTGNTTITVTAEYTIPGECNIDRNCFTEEQIESLLDKIAKLIDICFQPINFIYTEN